MPVADQLIDGAALHVVLSFMDGYSGYNQIFIAEEDIPKLSPSIGTFEWVVMRFKMIEVAL